MRNFTIQLNDQDELSYRGYWIDLNNKECYKDDGIHILTEVMNSNIYSDMISEIAEVVKIIEENLDWFKGCLNG